MKAFRSPSRVPVESTMKSMEGKASVVQRPRLTNYRQESLMSFVKHKLEIADDFMEDAAVYLQLHRFFFAVESLQKASRTLDHVSST